MPHYERFKKEINGMLREVPANQRLNPETHKLVYQAVVGLHVDELANEAAEAAIRKSKAPAQDSGSAAAGRGGGMSAKDESPEAVFGVDAVRSLHEVGRSADETYKRMGYKGGYKEYLEKNKDYL
jgi:hypothetical protein